MTLFVNNMRDIQRTIEEVRQLRGDLSTWLVHLTKGNVFQNESGSRQWVPAKKCLENIISTDRIAAINPIGHFNYKPWYNLVNENDLKAVSFTETPLSEIFLFINIKNKPLKFSPYGLVFDRDELIPSPIFAAPVLYLSQPNGNMKFLDKFKCLRAFGPPSRT